MIVTLRAGERLFINGAVIRLDRRASIELLNDVTFLLENHVLQVADATTPLRQIYFAVQVMLMDPSSAHSAGILADRLIKSALETFDADEVKTGLGHVASLLARARTYEALKTLRGLFPVEARLMFPAQTAGTPTAA